MKIIKKLVESGRTLWDGKKWNKKITWCAPGKNEKEEEEKEEKNNYPLKKDMTIHKKITTEEESRILSNGGVIFTIGACSEGVIPTYAPTGAQGKGK